MASSSVSQESLDTEDFAISIRKSKIRNMRARGLNPLPRSTDREREEDSCDIPCDQDTPGWGVIPEHESPSRCIATSRTKDKRTRPNHLHKGKLPKDKRKLREKRRSTGVGLGGLAHLPSTESTGDSLDEDDEDPKGSTETKRNTSYNEIIDEDNPQTPSDDRHIPKGFISRRTKSPSDLEADLEDNQDYDSTVSQSETNLTLIGKPDSKESNYKHIPKYGPGSNVDIPSTKVSHIKPYSSPNICDTKPLSSSSSSLQGSHHSRYGYSTNAAEWQEAEENSVVKKDLPVIKPLTSVVNRYKESKSDSDNNGYSGFRHHDNVQRSGVSHKLFLNRSKANESLEQLLEKEKEENRKLKAMLESKDKKIAELEKEVSSLNKDLEDFDDENQKLVLENNSLIRAVSNLSITSTAV
ncbi:PRKC apoptosis WT1 regulator protein-like [Ylistrum balloti]|uniref:PRKC apoptosis WT1 regulator protein-like n=1 Tax=Ylistrum balloti TaxID=509963 RepID=UPI0029059216|nr:PRKC apoptosis WT1 regulator protein-like [Ylistrum balloti]